MDQETGAKSQTHRVRTKRVQSTVHNLPRGRDLGESRGNKSGTMSNKQHDCNGDGKINFLRQESNIPPSHLPGTQNGLSRVNQQKHLVRRGVQLPKSRQFMTKCVRNIFRKVSVTYSL